MQKKKENIQLYIFGLVVFGFFVSFFVIIHPMIIFDTDDWNYLFAIRSALPTWGDWNPAKLFPEIIMAVVSQLAATMIYPLFGDYIGAMIWGHGLFTSVIILAYVISFTKLIKEEFKVTSEVAISYATLFVVFHFVIFRKYYGGNAHLFYTSNVTCYYNYLLPALLNCIAVMQFMRFKNDKSLWEKKSDISKGVFFLLVYLCIFSNLFSSVVLMAYVGGQLLISLYKKIKAKEFKLGKYIKENTGFLVIFILWITQQIFEMNGGRAEDISEGNLFQGILGAINVLWDKVYVVNYWFAGVAFTIILLTIIVVIRNRREVNMKRELGEIGQIFLALVLMISYLILLSAASSPGYIMRCDVLIGPAFMGFLILFIGIIIIAKRKSVVNVMIPFLIFLLICETSTIGSTFMDINMGGLPAETCIEIDNDIIEQIKTAVEEGEASMKLYVPDFGSADNWPIADYSGYRFSNALSKHGVIPRAIEIEIVPTKEKNEQFHLN